MGPFAFSLPSALFTTENLRLARNQPPAIIRFSRKPVCKTNLPESGSITLHGVKVIVNSPNLYKKFTIQVFISSDNSFINCLGNGM